MRDDIFLLKSHEIIVKLCGILPFDCLYKVKNSYIYLVYVCVIAFANVCLIFSNVNESLSAISSPKIPVYFKILMVFKNLSHLLIFISFLVSNMIFRKMTKNFRGYLKQFNKEYKHSDGIQWKEKTWRILRFFVNLATPVLLFLVDIRLGYQIDDIVKDFLKSIGIFFISTLLLYLCEICDVLTKRYCSLTGTMKSKWCNAKCHWLLRANDQKIFRKDIQKIGHFYKILFCQLEKINTVFGLTLLFTMAYIEVNVLLICCNLITSSHILTVHEGFFYYQFVLPVSVSFLMIFMKN